MNHLKDHISQLHAEYCAARQRERTNLDRLHEIGLKQAHEAVEMAKPEGHRE